MSPSNVSFPKLGDETSEVRLYLRDRNGDEGYQYRPDSEMAKCAVRVVSVCQALLKAEFVHHVLIGFIEEYGDERPEARFHDSVLIAEQIDKFISIICQKFPRLYVDDSITNSLVLRRHVEYSRNAEFQPSDQRIYLNGEMFGSMCSAAIKSNYNAHSKNSVQVTIDTQIYQNWWFLFANTLFREILQIFDTYITTGQDNTPSSFLAPLESSKPIFPSPPSSDLIFLEGQLFGGILSFFHDPNLKTCDRVVPLLTYENSEFRILSTSIEETLKEDIHLPYATKYLSEDKRVLLPADRLLSAALSIARRRLRDSTPSAQAAEKEDKLDTKAKGKQSKQRTR